MHIVFSERPARGKRKVLMAARSKQVFHVLYFSLLQPHTPRRIVIANVSLPSKASRRIIQAGRAHVLCIYIPWTLWICYIPALCFLRLLWTNVSYCLTNLTVCALSQAAINAPRAEITPRNKRRHKQKAKNWADPMPVHLVNYKISRENGEPAILIRVRPAYLLTIER